jgi:hypothetical protein
MVLLAVAHPEEQAEAVRVVMAVKVLLKDQDKMDQMAWVEAAADKVTPSAHSLMAGQVA